MISYSWGWNLTGGLLLALIATAAWIETKSNSLVPKSLLLWPAFVVVFGIENFIQGWWIFGVIVILCGIQAALVNLRRLNPWPSGAVWLGLVLAGLGFQGCRWFEQRLVGFLWVAVGVTKVIRERSASVEAGTPVWILLLYLQAILLASYR